MDNSSVCTLEVPMKPTTTTFLVNLDPTEELDFNLFEDLLRKPHIWDSEGQSLNVSISKTIDIIG